MGSGNGIPRCFEGAWSCPWGRLSVLQAECAVIKAICKLHGFRSVWLILKDFDSMHCMHCMHCRAMANFVKCLKPTSKDEKKKNAKTNAQENQTTFWGKAKNNSKEKQPTILKKQSQLEQSKTEKLKATLKAKLTAKTEKNTNGKKQTNGWSWWPGPSKIRESWSKKQKNRKRIHKRESKKARKEKTKQIQATTQQCRHYWFCFFFGFCFHVLLAALIGFACFFF